MAATRTPNRSDVPPGRRDAVERTVLDRIRAVARRRPGLFRVHRNHSRLYARARRLFGSWAAALAAAGFDHALVVSASNRRAIETRRRRRRRGRVPAAPRRGSPRGWLVATLEHRDAGARAPGVEPAVPPLVRLVKT
jgi:hypothetical protein